MTDEQIEELRAKIAMVRRDDVRPWIQPEMRAVNLVELGALERLLEERKRLLAALKRAERCGVTSQTEDGIQAAIAYAEESAP